MCEVIFVFAGRGWAVVTCSDPVLRVGNLGGGWVCWGRAVGGTGSEGGDRGIWERWPSLKRKGRLMAREGNSWDVGWDMGGDGDRGGSIKEVDGMKGGGV